jgi:hypothetical protein
MGIIERREPNELRACRTCGTDITSELDASYEYGYRCGYEKRASYEPQLEGAVDRIKALSDRVRPDDPDAREAAYGRGYQAAVRDALEALAGGQ